MRDALRLYLRFVSISLRGQMQYRASFIMLTIGGMITTGAEFLGLWALFERFGHIKGWTLPEMAFFYGLISLAFAIAEAVARGFDTFDGMIKRGDFDRLLLRPCSTALQVAGREVQLMRLGRFLQGLAVLLFAVSTLGIAWSLAKVLLVFVAVLGGACLFSGLLVLQATLAFWTTESLEIVNCFTYGGVESAQFPITIYRDWFRNFFIAVIPLACINYFPSLAILGRKDALGTPAWFHYLAPLAGVLFLVVALQTWKFGERHYRSTGS